MTGHVRVRTLLLIVGAAAALAIVPRVAGGVLDGAGSESRTTPSVREIHLVARDMTFYADGTGEPNPTLYARPGERVRLVLRNTDVGMSHDFVIRSWSVKTRLLKGKGEDRIEFTVPDTRGAHVYSCSPHAEMMGGTIVVN
jgi:plastocyanin